MKINLIKADEELIRVRIGVELIVAILLALALSGALNPVFAASGTTYTTDFPLTENPISEGGKWINGKAAGVDWGNVQTANGKAFGTALSSQYADPTAVLSGSWGPNQTVQATVVVTSSLSSCCHEVELRLRTTVTTYSITGYEINCSVSGQGYLQIVRWNGPLASFTQIGGAETNCVNGDVLKATMTGNVITVYKNGKQFAQATDNNAFTGGSPGVGFYDDGDSNWSNFGLTDFTASDTSNAPLSISTTSLPAGTAGTPYAQTITASGGAAPYTFSGSTNAPGLTLGSNGTVEGTPTTSGSFSVSVTVRDTVGATSAATIPLVVSTNSDTAGLAESCRQSRGNIMCTLTPNNMRSGTVITITGSGDGTTVTQSVTLN